MFVQSISITLKGAGKKFGREWIFRHADLEIGQGERLAILGLNGSGKSTLLQALTGFLSLSEGSLTYASAGAEISPELQFNYVSLASPYLELIEDFTLSEMIAHAAIYKPFINKLGPGQVLELSGLKPHGDKFIRLFSSGMKQRAKLALAILADAPVLFLDEPTTNLDASVIAWYSRMISDHAAHKTIVVASNSIAHEYEFCSRYIDMTLFKPSNP